jgi:hypothetical protein
MQNHVIDTSYLQLFWAFAYNPAIRHAFVHNSSIVFGLKGIRWLRALLDYVFGP